MCYAHPQGYYPKCISSLSYTCWQKLYNAFVRIVNSGGSYNVWVYAKTFYLKANSYSETIKTYSNNKTATDYQIFNP
jgi:hypothetical protein